MQYETQKVILINPKDRTITEHAIIKSGEGVREELHMEDIYRLLDCELFTVLNIDEANDLFLDDEGLFVAEQSFFQFNSEHMGAMQLAGNGLVMGFDGETGESLATTLAVEQVAERVQWLTLEAEGLIAS